MAEMREKDPRARVPQRVMTQMLAEEGNCSPGVGARLGLGSEVGG